MGKAIDLIQNEKDLFNAITKCVEWLHDYYNRPNKSLDREEFDKVYTDMAQKAHQLHKILKNRGLEPKHHKYMLENRKVPIDDEEFYNHIHPVEDLLAFINNPDANNDPEDTTVGATFTFKIFTRRWGHYDEYDLTRTQNGWRITGGSIFNDNDCRKDGTSIKNEDKEIKGGLHEALEHDCVNYPHQLGKYLEAIWSCASEGADKKTVQKALNSLAKWISTCEKLTPHIDILEDFL